MEQGHSQERVVQLGQSAMWPNQGEWSAPFQLYGCHVQPSDGSRNSQPTSGWPLPWLPPPPPPPPPNYQWQSSAVQQQTHNYDHYQDSNYGNGYGHQQAEQVDTYTDVSFGRRKNSHQNDKEWCFGNGSVKEEPYEYKTQREMDQDYINKFLVERGAFKNTTESKPSKRSLKISELGNTARRCIEKMDQLQVIHQRLNNEAFSADESTWRTLESDAVSLRNDVKLALSSIPSEDVQTIKQKIKIRSKKRARMRNQKQLMKKETQERIQRTIEMDKKINEWQESVRNASLAAEMERKMKKEADSILSEVRKKRADATRLLELVKAIVTLRSLRKQSTEFKGICSTSECDEHFLKTTTDLTTMLTMRLDEYREEERALQVMLDEEHQVTRTSALKLRQQQQLEKLATANEEKLLSLFGSKDLPTFSYWTYHTLADTNLDALIQVRQCWDSWLVSSETPRNSSIPLGWIIPAKPSSEAWNPYLNKDT